MADDHTSGLASAVASAIAAADAAGPARLPLLDVEELDLFHDPAKAAVDPKGAATQAVQQARRHGRPRGSTNKRTAKWRDYLASRYAHPLEVLAATISRAPAELAAELQCSIFEAFALQQRAAAELAPYMESKMPTLAVVAQDSGVTLFMPGFNAPAGSTIEHAEAGLDAIDNLDGLTLEVLPSPSGSKVDGG